MSNEWDFYRCRVDNKAASIFVDLGIREQVPLVGLQTLVWLRLYMRQPRDDGLSAESEFDRLVEIEHVAIAAASQADGKMIYVGRNTSDGQREFYFYSTNGREAENRLASAMHSFPEYRFETGGRPDPDWTVYHEFLYPSTREYEAISNDRVLRLLERDGDDHKIARDIYHWVYFATRDDRSRFIELAAGKGYSLIDEDDASDPRPFRVTIARVSTVDYHVINAAVLELYDLAEECNGEYTGWETSVKKGE
jgi:uncharacterized protein (TIGR01619 family)